MHNVKDYILLSVLFFALNSCSKQDLEAVVPSYITINNFTLSTDAATEGSNSQNISDAWVYVDNDLVGVYELPVTFPVLKEGNAKLDVYPGIKEDGISERRAKYIFYNPYSQQINLQKDKTITINPTTTYTSTTHFYWMENFESASLPFTYNTTSDTIVFKTSAAFEGNYAGQVSLIPGMDFFECMTPSLATLPRTGTTVFLELNFKCNQPIMVGMYADSEQLGVFYLNTTSEWKKIYLNFTEPVRTRSYAGELKIFFGFQSKVDYPEFMFDNLKVVYM